MKPMELHQQIYLMLKPNVQLETTLTQYKDAIAFPAAIAQQLKEAAFGMCRLQGQIANHFVEVASETGVKLFDITSKAHMLLHCAMMSKYINPKVVWCFSGEDFMHKHQTLAMACVRGLNGAQASVKMAHHHRLGSH